MQAYQHDFLDFALKIGALKLGDFLLKSGRRSPYFFNTGLFDSGERLGRLARAYAQCIRDSGLAFDMLYGPAYKGIPLATATSLVLALEHGQDYPYAFNRKEAKDHGEGGQLVGRPLRGRVLILDDVITAGTSVRESVAVIRDAGAEPAGVLIALDREERGAGERSAVSEVEQSLGIPVLRVFGLGELIAYLEGRGEAQELLDRLRDYRATYGCAQDRTLNASRT